MTLEQDLRNVLALSDAVTSSEWMDGYPTRSGPVEELILAAVNLIRQHGKKLLGMVSGEVSDEMVDAFIEEAIERMPDRGRESIRACIAAAMAKESAGE